jgi:hypothetical protein
MVTTLLYCHSAAPNAHELIHHDDRPGPACLPACLPGSYYYGLARAPPTAAESMELPVNL